MTVLSFFQHRLFKNTSALALIQVASYVLPLILIPYYTHVFGLELFGVVAFSLAAVQLAMVFTDFGFALSATEDISRNRDSKGYLEETVGSILLIKVGLFSLAAGAVFLLPSLKDEYAEYQLLFTLSAIPILGLTFQPIWFFQGIEKMNLVAIYTVSAKSLYLVLALVFVREPADFYLVPVMNGISQVLAAILGLLLVHREGYRIRWPGKERTKSVFRASSTFFVSRASVAMYTSGSAFFLGIFGSATQVAIFSIAELLYRAIQGVFSPVGQALYPYMVREKNIGVFFKILAAACTLSVVGVVVGYYVSPALVPLLFGGDYAASVPILYLFFVVVIINTPAVLLGYPFLGAFDATRYANYSVIIGSAVYILLLLWVGTTYGLDAVVVVYLVMVAEGLVFLIRGGIAVHLLRGRRQGS